MQLVVQLVPEEIIFFQKNVHQTYNQLQINQLDFEKKLKFLSKKFLNIVCRAVLFF